MPPHSFMADDDGDVHDSSPLLSPRSASPPSSSTTTRNKAKFSPPSGIIINRTFIFLVLAGIVAVSVIFKSTQKSLTQQLSFDEEKIRELQKTVQDQAVIIARFNESVTNTDVLKKLSSMEEEWEHDRQKLLDDLKTTRTQVFQELNNTMDSLDKSVKKAEHEIQDQVDIVQKNFDQYAVHTEAQFSMENNFMVYQLAGTFTLLSCLISCWHIGAHLRKMNQPAIQRKILAILWMCPIYAVTSWLSLVFPDMEGYLAIIKDAYEAYIIYQFLSFCIAVLGKGDRNQVVDMLSKQVDHLTPPFRLFACCCQAQYVDDHALANAILTQCQAFTMQFVFWRPVTTIANFFLNKYQYYGPWADGPHDWKAPQFWVAMIQNLSIFIAFAGLLKFYHAVDKDLVWCRPFAKFLCIKGVVFMTFWQGLAITILAETTDFGGDPDKSDEWAQAAQNFLICLEMLLFSIAHFYCFPVEEWQDGYQANYKKAKFGESLALNDFFTDLKLVLTSESGLKKHKKHKHHKSKIPSEPTVPEGDNETVDESIETGDDRGSEHSFSTNDDIEDPKRALVNAITQTIEEMDGNGDGDNDGDNIDRRSANDDGEGNTDTTANVRDAQMRIGNMLGEMLAFSPPPRPVASRYSSNSSSLNNDDDNDDDDDDSNSSNGSMEEGKGGYGGLDSAKSSAANISEIEEPDSTILYDNNPPTEGTGLLTGETLSNVSRNLKPSIFTSIAKSIDSSANTNKEEAETPEGHSKDGWVGLAETED
mmetsp:Transcript_11927/g.28663  ORF Transcript_11927/g.28663 Transcript_11927/m.28663 type:complete len:759 (+) Transcript_11927:295-2571(+)